MQAQPKGWQTARGDANHTGELLVTMDGTAYTAQDIVRCEVERRLLDKTAEIGNAVASVLTLEVNQKADIARCACVELQYRLELHDANTDYIPKGRFWVNTREAKGRYLVLTCYDAMLKAEQDYLTQTTADDWPKPEADCAAEIAKRIGVELDPRTHLAEGDAHKVDMPVGRTMRDVLKSIAAANGGNWCITNGGKLLLVPFAGTGDILPPVTGAPDFLGQQPITGVELTRETDTDTAVYRAGTDAGIVLACVCSYATQALADEVLVRLRGTVYKPYRCGQRHIDPAAEPGDTVPVSGQGCTIYNLTESLSKAYCANLEAPQENGELEQEYPYLTTAQRTARRLQSTIKATSEIRKTQEEIAASVTAINTALEADYAKKEYVSSQISQTAEEINLSVQKQVETIDNRLDADYAKKEYVSSQISQTAEEINLSVQRQVEAIDNELDNSYTKKAKVRSVFAMSSEAVTIDTGRLTFNANSIVINSTNFKLDENGNITASGTFKSTNNGYTAELSAGSFQLTQGGDRVRIQALPSGAGVVSVYGNNTSRLEPNALVLGVDASGVCHGAIMAESANVKMLNGYNLTTFETTLNGYKVGIMAYYVTKGDPFGVGEREVSVYDWDDNPYSWVQSEVAYTSNFEVFQGSKVSYSIAAWLNIVQTGEYSQSAVVTVQVQNASTGAVLKEDTIESTSNIKGNSSYISRSIAYTFGTQMTARLAIYVRGRQENSYQAAYGYSCGNVANINVYP